MADRGTVYSTGGDETWPVTYRIQISGTSVSGTIEFEPGTQLQTNNPWLPVYLRLNDDRWAVVHLPVKRPDETVYSIEGGSHLIDAPPWDGRR